MGGDHKCPLCEATFTRPQHVGRHLRAHTGDRPYGCKECPLRFARSDLLSRHVNKTHRPPDENAPAKEPKKGRRKSLGSHADGQPLLKSQDKARAASFSLAPGSHTTFRPPPTHMPPPQTSITPNYPNQPLPSAYAAGPSTYRTTGMPGGGMLPPTMAPTFVNPFATPMTAPSVRAIPTIPPAFGAPAMAAGTSSDQGSSSSDMTRNASNGSWTGTAIAYADVGPKRRACDQCNHSKLRCDSADPCTRCVSKNFTCSYNKPHKPRTIIQPILALPQQLPSGYSGASALQLNTSMSPDSSFSSPYSSTSPIASQLMLYPSASSTLLQQEYERRRSAGNQQPQYRPMPRNSLPANPYTQNSPVVPQTWQLPDVQPQLGYAPLGYERNLVQQNQSMVPTFSQSPVNPYQPMLPASAAWNQIPQPQHTPIEHQRQLSTSTAVLSEQSSSPNGLVVTPAMTTNSISPPAEQLRTDSRGPSAVDPQIQYEPEAMLGEMTNGRQGAGKGMYDLSSSVIPTSTMNPSLDHSAGIYPTTFPGMSSNMAWVPPTTVNLATNPTSISAPEAPIDRMYQFRTTSIPHPQDDDDTTASQADSSAMSSFLDMDDMAYQQSLEHRRRASTNGGVWATAFNNMTLHDSAGNPLPNPPGLPLAPGTMFHPSQVQMDAAKRPSMSAIGNTYADPSGRLPSMSDVKDLWKLFMTDPLTGPTPSKEKSNFLDLSAQPVTTPRPGLGGRTLSKSNSMPDLKSPTLSGPQAFLTSPHRAGRDGAPGGAHDGATPIAPVPPRLNPHVPVAGVNGSANPEALKEWQEKIKSRQASFSMAMQHPGPMGRRANSKGGSTSRSGSIAAGRSAMDESSEFPFAASQSPEAQMLYGDYGLLNASGEYNRPMASVFQRTQALNQTLGPERAPSFGVGPNGQLYDTVGGITPTSANFPRASAIYQSHPSQMQQPPLQSLGPPPPLMPYQMMQQPGPIQGMTTGQTINAQSAAAGGKMTSALARPGNKRLASQSLVGAEGKKANFLVFDGHEEGDEGAEEAQGDAGGMGYGMMGVGGEMGRMGGMMPVLPAEWQTTANA